MTATTINSFPSLHSWNSPRSWTLAIIILLHAGFFWALSSGLTPKFIRHLLPEAPTLIPVVQKPAEPIEQPKIDPVELRPAAIKPETPLPQPQFDDIETAPRIVDSVPTPPGGFPGTGPVTEPVRMPVIMEPRIDARRGLSERNYPSSEIRQGHEGQVLLAVYVLADGRVGDVRIDSSSGYPKLDESALREARRWRFLPGTRDGQPFATWKTVPITFRLDKM